jgi:hypothetical protein
VRVLGGPEEQRDTDFTDLTDFTDRSSAPTAPLATRLDEHFVKGTPAEHWRKKPPEVVHKEDRPGSY